MTAAPLSECLTLLFETKSITASDLDVVLDNARCPSDDLVYRAVAAENLFRASCVCILGKSFEAIGSIGSDPEADEHNESISSSKFGSDQRSSRGDSRGTRNKKRAGSLASPARMKPPFLEAPSRPELALLKEKKEKIRRSNSRESLPEWLQRLPVEAQSSRVVLGKRDASRRSVNEALLLSHPATAPLIRNAVVSKTA
jgi:hypothetical protein